MLSEEGDRESAATEAAAAAAAAPLGWHLVASLRRLSDVMQGQDRLAAADGDKPPNDSGLAVGRQHSRVAQRPSGLAGAREGTKRVLSIPRRSINSFGPDVVP